MIDAFQTTTKLSIPTLDDTIQELHGNITVAIQPGLNYRVATGGNSSATINILNDDQPVIRISGEDIVEGENAIFTLTSSNPVGYSFDVNVKIAETGNFLANSYPETVEFNTGQTTATLELEIDDDNVKEDNGEIQVAILSGDDYQVALEPDNSAVIEVEDNENFPTISISAIAESLVEGDNVEFEITANGISDLDLEVQVSIDDVSQKYIKGSLNKTVVIAAGTTSKTFHWLSDDDNVYESSEDVTATLEPGENYVIADAPGNTVVVEISDNELSQPVVQIAPVNELISEGEDAEFNISISPLAEDDLPIRIQTIQGESDFLDDNFSLGVTIPAYQASVVLTFQTINDQIVEENGELEIVILTGRGYLVQDAPDDRAVITITDNENLPELSISVVHEKIVESDDVGAEFVIQSSQVITTPLDVTIELIEFGQFLVDESDQVVTIGLGDIRTKFVVDIVSDDILELSGYVDASLQTSSDYVVSSLQSTARVSISDDDNPPGISIISATPEAKRS